MKIMVTHSLQFVTGQILIACNLMSHILLNIAQTRTKAVIRKIIFSVMTVEPAYQKVNSFGVPNWLTNLFENIESF